MVVVTGSTGHIGVNLVRALVASGREVRALIHTHTPDIFSDLDIETATMDLLDPASIPPALEGAEVVYHLAALISITGPQGGAVHAVNVDGVRNVAEAALNAGVRRFVHVSSCHAFDINTTGPVVDETADRPGPHTPAYDRSKADGEAALREVIAQGLDAVIVNPCGVIGPIDHRPSRMGQALLDLRDGKLPSLLDGGFNWVDVRDVVASTIAAETKGRTGENYLLGGHYVALPELMQLAASICGTRCPRFVSPMWLAQVGAPFVEAWTRIFGGEPLYTSEALHALRANPNLSHDKAARELGHAPRPIEDTLREAYTSFAELNL